MMAVLLLLLLLLLLLHRALHLRLEAVAAAPKLVHHCQMLPASPLTVSLTPLLTQPRLVLLLPRRRCLHRHGH